MQSSKNEDNIQNTNINNNNFNNIKFNNNKFKENLIKYSKKILFVILTIIIVNIIQWLCIQFLYNYCSKPGFWGFIENLLSLGSPMCHFVNSIQYNLSQYYVQLWLNAGIGIVGIFAL